MPMQKLKWKFVSGSHCALKCVPLISLSNERGYLNVFPHVKDTVEMSYSHHGYTFLTINCLKRLHPVMDNLNSCTVILYIIVHGKLRQISISAFGICVHIIQKLIMLHGKQILPLKKYSCWPAIKVNKRIHACIFGGNFNIKDIRNLQSSTVEAKLFLSRGFQQMDYSVQWH